MRQEQPILQAHQARHRSLPNHLPSLSRCHCFFIFAILPPHNHRDSRNAATWAKQMGVAKEMATPFYPTGFRASSTWGKLFFFFFFFFFFLLFLFFYYPCSHHPPSFFYL